MITDSPTDNNLDRYLQEYKKHNVSTIVRLCDSYYDSSIIKKAGIDVVNLSYEDGGIPNLSIINQWHDTVSKYKNSTIAVHCLSGLGRAPLLVCLSLIENGMDTIEAIEMIRRHRNGALNSKQIDYLIRFKKTEKNSYSCLIN
jgi:protein tyrosine phosphatase type 4A